MEEHRVSRNSATGLSSGIAIVLGVLCALSFGILSDFTIFGMTIFNLFDYVSSNILLPVGGLFISLFVGWTLDKKFLDRQLATGDGRPSRYLPLLRLCIRYVAPVSIVIIFIYGLGR